MASEGKKVDRLYVDKRDLKEFNRLKEKDSPFAGAQNKDAFLAAMVVGYAERSKIELKKKEGYFRKAYLTDRELALIRAIAVSEDGSLDVLLDEQEMFSIAEEYAAGGIKLLKTRVFSMEFGSYAKRLESELLQAYERIRETKPENRQNLEDMLKLPVSDLIDSGENKNLELKSSLIWDYQKKGKSKLIGMILAKTVSCFMNSKGGILLIGVDDTKRILGLEKDLSQLESGTLDELELYFTGMVIKYLGKIHRPYVDIKFEKVNGKDVAVVQVKRTPWPVYVKYKGNKEFYIRSGNSCQPLDIQDATSYIKDNWPLL